LCKPVNNPFGCLSTNRESRGVSGDEANQGTEDCDNDNNRREEGDEQEQEQEQEEDENDRNGNGNVDDGTNDVNQRTPDVDQFNL